MTLMLEFQKEGSTYNRLRGFERKVGPVDNSDYVGG